MITTKHVVDVPGLFDSRPRGYVQCVTAGRLVFVAGQVGVDEQLQIVSPDFEPQARQVLLNVRLALEAASGGVDDINSITIYLTDMNNLRAFAAIKQEIWGDTATTSTAVGVTALAIPGLLIEVTVTAVLPEV